MDARIFSLQFPFILMAVGAGAVAGGSGAIGGKAGGGAGGVGTGAGDTKAGSGGPDSGKGKTKGGEGGKDGEGDGGGESGKNGEEGGGGGGESAGGGGGLTSPEGILMLCIAIMLDCAGFIIFLLGTWFAIDDYGILDILGMVIIGGWMLMRSGSSGAKTAVKKGLKRFIEASAVELVPFLGGASPSWVWLVYKTLKD
jgi:hypothetical protein